MGKKNKTCESVPCLKRQCHEKTSMSIVLHCCSLLKKLLLTVLSDYLKTTLIQFYQIIIKQTNSFVNRLCVVSYSYSAESDFVRCSVLIVQIFLQKM